MSHIDGTKVGPVFRMADEVERLIDAIREDNPDQEIEITDRGAYIRVHCELYMKVTQASIERNIGRAFPMRLLETMMSSWAGRIQVGTDRVEWSLKAEPAAA